jgi:hypothetical protein
MNRMDRSFTPGVEARLQYLHTEFRVIRHGSFVRCAATGEPIPIEDLRYWNVDRQEPYAGPAAVLKRVADLQRR